MGKRVVVLMLVFILGFSLNSFTEEAEYAPIVEETEPQPEVITTETLSQMEMEEPAALPIEEAVPAEEISLPEETAPIKEAAPAEAQSASADSLAMSQNVTLDFKEADIRNVLKIISFKSGVNIVTTPEVMGNITIRLVDVPWEKALDVILRTYGFGYEKIGNIITVAPIEKLTALKKQEVELAQVQPTVTEVFHLKFIDAQDAKKALEPQLSARGKITVLEMTGQAGWEFGGGELGKRKRIVEEKLGRSKVLIISDVPPVLDKVKEVVAKIDVQPLQVLIEAKVMEVSRDKLKDIGFDFGTGTTGAESSTISATDGLSSDTEIGGHSLGNQITPAIFGAKSSSLSMDNTGMKFLLRKVTGTEFEVMIHALEEDVDTNTLSAPKILTLNNQEASILIGTKFPILKTEISGTETAVTQVTLDYYQDIGIQLNVVPQIGINDYINMVVHPVVSTITSSATSITSATYPIIDVREAETRVLMRDNETIVIGGLLKDVKSNQVTGVPFLKDIPFLGFFFRRTTDDVQKIDLLIFLTAKIVREGEFNPEDISRLRGK
ncbi:MAG: type IV pilus secretin PilQ [Candidatus Omnitrophota bacterium]